MSQARKVQAEEIPAVTALSDKIFRKPGQVSMRDAFKLLFSESNTEHLYMVEDDSKPVSFMGVLPAVLNIAGCHVPIASLGSVCTDPDYRGKQYASKLLDMVLKQLHEEKAAFLFVSGDRGLYIRNDCMSVGQTQLFSFHASQNFKLSGYAAGPCVEIRPWQYSDVKEMLDVLQKERVYFERTVEDFTKLIDGEALLSCYPAKQEVFIRKTAGVLDAYIVFGTWEKNGQTVAEAIEYAGVDEGIIQLVCEAMLRFNISTMTTTVSNHRRTLAYKFSSLGYSFRSEPIIGTIRLIDFSVLWNSLKPYFAIELGTDTANNLQCEVTDNGYKISLGEESYIVDLRMATSMVFNGVSLVDNTPLKEALSRIFPIPIENPNNLNYV